MRVYLFVFWISVLMIQSGYTQHNFHRTYPGADGKNILCISSTQLKDGIFVALEIEVKGNANENKYSDTFFITAYKPKGDINWSKAFALDATHKGLKQVSGSIIQGDNDSIYYSLISNATDKPNKIIGTLDKGGANGWMKSYSSVAGKSDGLSESHLLTNYNRALFSAHKGGVGLKRNIVLSKINYDGKNLWRKLLDAKNKNGQNIDEQVRHLSFAPDSTLLLSGIVDSNTISSFIAVADTFGTLKWSRRYFHDTAILNAYDVLQYKDSSYLLSGVMTSGNAAPKGFLIKTNKRGIITWGKTVVFNPKDTTLVKHIAFDKDNKVLVAGTNTDSTSQKSYNFVMKLNDDGTVIWKTKYPRVGGTDYFTGQLFGSKDGGSAYITSVIEDGKLRPSFIKLNSDGETSCEEDILNDILLNANFKTDTLVWDVTNDVIDPTVSTNYVSDINTYDVPSVTLEVRPFCPEEPIDWTFHAKTKGATYYKWSTGLEGPKADSLRVFEEGKYSVTVTINEGVCFMLCDTSELARYDKPQAQLVLSLGNFCANDSLTIRAGYTPGHPQVKSIVWSTGVSNVNSIEIDKPGTYKITLVDGCDESATAEIGVGEFPKKITTATITEDFKVDCFNGLITGTLTAMGNSNGLGIERYKWSSGATTQNLTLTNTRDSIFSVTVIDGCGGTATVIDTLKYNGEGITKAEIMINSDSICKGIVLNAVADKSGIFKYVWSIADTTASINVNKAGSYAVTITDRCNNNASASVVIGEKELTPKDILYAHVFFPDGFNYKFDGSTKNDTLAYESLSLNRSFGPVNKAEYCLNQVENYEFYVFNRWGQQVFESKDIRDEWDGQLNGKDAQTDTYIWVVKYSIFGFEKKLKGDVTLIRR